MPSNFENVACDNYENHIADLEAKVARLQAALEPFRRAAAFVEVNLDDGCSLSRSTARHKVTVGDLRRARKASD